MEEPKEGDPVLVQGEGMRLNKVVYVTGESALIQPDGACPLDRRWVERRKLMPGAFSQAISQAVEDN
jgi:hypothetical protein